MTQFSHILSAIDAHTGGEPARLVLSGLPPIPGQSMAQKKAYFRRHLDHWRTLLMQEPRGHKDMFGVLLTPSPDPRADHGVLFIDSHGAIDMCGHGLMALTTALIAIGMAPAVEPFTTLRFDTPAGLVEAKARIEGGAVSAVTLRNVPAFVYEQDVGIMLPELGEIAVDVVFGGNFFALVSASRLGVEVRPENVSRLISLGMAVKQAVNAALRVAHPEWAHIHQVELTKIVGPCDPLQRWQKGVVIFGAGQVDRSPCGTGTSAAMALAHAKGDLALGEPFISEGLLGSRFQGQLEREVRLGDRQAVVPLVTGSAHLTGFPQFVVDPNDPFRYGFLLDACP